MSQATRSVDSTPIDSACCYGINDFMRRTGLNKTSVRRARRAGLIVRKVGCRNFVLGSDWIDFVREKAIVVT